MKQWYKKDAWRHEAPPDADEVALDDDGGEDDEAELDDAAAPTEAEAIQEGGTPAFPCPFPALAACKIPVGH